MDSDNVGGISGMARNSQFLSDRYLPMYFMHLQPRIFYRDFYRVLVYIKNQ